MLLRDFNKSRSSNFIFCIQVDYSHGHCCDHVVDVEPGLSHLAAVSVLDVLELVHDIDSDVFF